jgi:hypothetical protein
MRTLLLAGVAQHADEHHGRLQVAAHIHVVHRDQADFADVKFAADGFADGALQKFAHAFMSQGGHKK